jgi:putative ABC transport system ATP-binding protein
MGPSGCGKSTLLSLIGGLDIPTSGKVTVGGIEISRLAERERTRLRRERFGFVFQTNNLLPFLTASENVALQLTLGGDGDATSRPSDLLADLGMSAEADKLPDQMSGGQRQRVAVAIAVAHQPAVILADEPTGSLDVANAQAVVDLLLTAAGHTGATLIVVSHDPDVCSRMSRVITLRDGRLVEDTARHSDSEQR